MPESAGPGRSVVPGDRVEGVERFEVLGLGLRAEIERPFALGLGAEHTPQRLATIAFERGESAGLGEQTKCAFGDPGPPNEVVDRREGGLVTGFGQGVPLGPWQPPDSASAETDRESVGGR